MSELFDKLEDIETFHNTIPLVDDDTSSAVMETEESVIEHKNDKIGLYYFKDFKKISKLHHIPYVNKDNTINMICEIPRYTRKKYKFKHIF